MEARQSRPLANPVEIEPTNPAKHQKGSQALYAEVADEPAREQAGIKLARRASGLRADDDLLAAESANNPTPQAETANRDREISDEPKAKRGKPLSAEHRAKISEFRKGKKHSPED